MKLSSKGTAETLRTRITDHVGEKVELDTQVREIAAKFKNDVNKKISLESVSAQTSYPMSPTIHILRGSTPAKVRRTAQLADISLGSQELFGSHPQINEHEKSITEQIDELDDMYESLTQGDLGKGLEEKQTNDIPNPTSINNTMWYDDTTKESLALSIKKLEFLVQRSEENVAAKDRQIESMEESLAVVVSTNTQLMEKHDNDIASIREEQRKTNEDTSKYMRTILQEVKALKKNEINTSKMEEQIQMSNEKLDNTLERLEHMSQQNQSMKTILENVSNGSNPIPPQTDGNTTAGTHSAIQTRVHSIAAPPPKEREKSETALLIGDSNTKNLVPNLLHEQKKVVIEPRFTLEQAMENIPQIEKPQEVSDIIMLTGVNNVKQQNANIPETIQKLDKVCKKYSDRFPNAKIHIGSIAPSNEKHVQYNNQLRNLATERQVPFISTDTMFDRNSGSLRPDMVNGIHYTKKGLATFAKEIKRSLYGNHKPTHQSRNHISHPVSNTFPHNNQRPNHASLNNTGLSDPRQEMQKFLSMAISCLGNM